MKPVKRNSGNRRLVLTLGGAVAGMFAFAFLLTPLYEVFCELTGLDSERLTRATQPSGAAVASEIDENRKVTVEFLTNTINPAAWEFQPGELSIEVTPGRTAETVFYAENLLPHDVISVTRPSVRPLEAVSHVSKQVCFCFEEQAFAAGERRELPMRFTIDSQLPAHVETVTLAYTLFTAEPGLGGS